MYKWNLVPTHKRWRDVGPNFYIQKAIVVLSEWNGATLSCSTLYPTILFHTFHTDCCISWVIRSTWRLPVCIHLLNRGHFFIAKSLEAAIFFFFPNSECFLPYFSLLGRIRKSSCVISLGTKTIRLGPCWGGGSSASHYTSELRIVWSEDEIGPPPCSATRQTPNSMNEVCISVSSNRIVNIMN